jgi:hypothetical protein
VAFSIADTLNPSQSLGSSGSDEFSIANAYQVDLSSDYSSSDSGSYSSGGSGFSIANALSDFINSISSFASSLFGGGGSRGSYTYASQSGGGSGFSIGNAASPPTFGYTPTASPAYSPSSSDPLWLQILYGLQQAASVIDPYILTEQEKAQMELQRAQLELQRAQLQASIRTEPAVPAWVWVVVALAGVALLVVLLRE